MNLDEGGIEHDIGFFGEKISLSFVALKNSIWYTLFTLNAGKANTSFISNGFNISKFEFAAIYEEKWGQPINTNKMTAHNSFRPQNDVSSLSNDMITTIG